MTAPQSLSPAQKKGVQPSLTLCPAPNLDWSRPGTPASDEFGDIYFSVDGGLEETRAVYLQACGLPERWREPEFETQPFVIGELGFGTGLNFLAVWQIWKAHKRAGQRLHFVSVEKYPLSRQDLETALSCWPELQTLARALLAVWPGRVRGTHILHLADGVTLTLCHDDVEAALTGLTLQADAWFLDGFSPAKNPEMWSEDVMAHIGRLSALGARVGTFTAAGFVREGLAKAGFKVSKTQGFGRKRHRIEAVMSENSAEPKDADIRPVIIGGGIAGASLASAFKRRGIRAIVIDADDGTAASGNAAAIVKPRLDRQDSPLARFALSAYLYAAREYRRLGAVLSEGVRHAPQTPEQAARFKALAAEPALPPEEMVLRDGDLVFPRAQVIDPQKARTNLLEGTQSLKGRAASVQQNKKTLEVLNEDGEVLASGTHVVFAAGAGVRDMNCFDPLELRYSRGQISWAKNHDRESALTYGGYAIPLGGDMLLGATHSRLTGGNPYALSRDEDAYNFESYLNAVGETAMPSSRPSRASVRVNSKTTWPFAADIAPRISVMTGLGSRGFVFAPLMAELFAAEVMGEPHVFPPKLRRNFT